MADYILSEIKAALRTVIAAVDDIGVTVTDQRAAEQDAEVLALIESLDADHEPHGCSIIFQRLSESSDGSGCRIEQALTYGIELFYPYQRKRPSGITSAAAFELVVGALAAAIRNAEQLGLDARVRHAYLKSTDDLAVGHFEGTGGDTREVHFGKFTLEVLNLLTI